jgi:NAD(P)-dependent dehydrogenase (short-subunit alcohol dehydrogenase family)
MRFRGRVAIITGGSNGLGKATAYRMAAERGQLAFVDRDSQMMSAVAQTIEVMGGS